MVRRLLPLLLASVFVYVYDPDAYDEYVFVGCDYGEGLISAIGTDKCDEIEGIEDIDNPEGLNVVWSVQDWERNKCTIAFNPVCGEE